MYLTSQQYFLRYYIFLCFLSLPLTYLQPTEKKGNEAYCTVSFWSIQKNGKQELLKLIDQERLIKSFKGRTPNQYKKNDYQVKVNSPAWPAVLRFLQDLKKSSTSSWRDLNLLYMYKKTDPEIEEQVNTFYKTGIIGTDMDIFITKKKEEKKISVYLLVQGLYKKFLDKLLKVYPTTTITDLECYLIYHSDMVQEEKDMLFRQHYSFYAHPSEYHSKNARSDYEMETIKDINSEHFTWQREEFICDFYLNRDGTLLSKDQLSDSSKIQNGMLKEWKHITVDVKEGQYLLPIVSRILPDTLLMNIEFRSIVSKNNKHRIAKIRNWYPNKKEYTHIDSTTVSFSVVGDKRCRYALIESKKKSEKKIKCILKKNSNILLEEFISIRKTDKNVVSDTLFIEAYLYLVNKAGYKIDQVQIQYPSITYQTKENSSAGNNLEKGIYMYGSMFEYQKNLNIESYTFMIPKGVNLIQEETNQSIIIESQKKGYDNYCQIKFWTVKKDGKERLLEYIDMMTLKENMRYGKIPSEYFERRTFAEPYSLLWPLILKFLKNLDITVTNPWLNLEVCSLVDSASWVRQIEVFNKAGNIDTNIDILLTKKKGKPQTPINLVVKNWSKELFKKKLLVHPNTRVGDLYCYLIYYADMPQEVKDGLLRGSYDLKSSSNQLLNNENNYREKQIKEINSDHLTWTKKQVTCSFYLNKNETLLSEDQVNDPEKIGKRMKEEWKCIKVNIEDGKPLLPVISEMLPNTSMMNIQIGLISEKNDNYYIDKITPQYMSGTKKKYRSAFTLTVHCKDQPAKYALIEYKRKSEKKIKCILKMEEESLGTVLEETLNIGRGNDPLDDGLHFIDAYTYLVNKAGYQITPPQVINSSVLITYKEKENNSKDNGQIKKEDIRMSDSMFKHQENLNIESYTFMILKGGKLIQEKDNYLIRVESKEQDQNHHSDILPNNDQQDSNNIKQLVKYTIIGCIALAIVSLVGYLIWKSKKKKEKTDSSAQTTE